METKPDHSEKKVKPDCHEEPENIGIDAPYDEEAWKNLLLETKKKGMFFTNSYALENELEREVIKLALQEYYNQLKGNWPVDVCGNDGVPPPLMQQMLMASVVERLLERMGGISIPSFLKPLEKERAKLNRLTGLD